jgi:hypothetical protein
VSRVLAALNLGRESVALFRDGLTVAGKAIEAASMRRVLDNDALRQMVDELSQEVEELRTRLIACEAECRSLRRTSSIVPRLGD